MRTRGRSAALVATLTGLALIAGLLSAGSPPVGATSNNSVTAPDTAGIVGRYTSLTLDASGNPVISHWDFGNRDLRLVHCNDASCAGGDESITAPDTAGDVGSYTSLELDGAGYPVVSYYDATNLNLKVMHCNDANCAGADESITAPDFVGAPVQFTELVTSLELDGAGNPVVSYHDGINADLKVLHCGDTNCTAGNSITAPDTAGAVGYDSALALDGAGNPVVTYRDATNNGLKVLHCNDANCSGGGESTITADAAGAAGAFTSVTLDGSGRPVVSYWDTTNFDLKILHCGNANCTSGNSIVPVDTKGNVGAFTSLLLDSAGNPAVSYYDYNRAELKVLRCGNANCTSGNKMAVADASGIDDGQFTSLALDSAGRPVVSYLDNWDSDLKVLHCSDAICAGGEESVTSPDTVGDVGENTSLALDAAGLPVVSYYDSTNSDLKVMHCNDANCSGGNDSTTAPDTAGDVGVYTSLALDGAGNPVVSYHDVANFDLKLLHCNDANCSGGDDSVTAPDTAGDVGLYTSLALDAAGNPVISYFDESAQDLKLLHCNDANCAGGDDSITSPDTAGDVGFHTSLALDGVGNPVVSYYDAGNGDLKLLHCNDANCVGGDESITTPDAAGDLAWYTSLALDGSGNPVISYFDLTNQDLKLLHCNDANCAGVGESITAPDTTGNVGAFTSLVLNGAGNPVVSYYATSTTDLRLLRCGNPNCTAGNTITSPDTIGNVGQSASLALDGEGNAVVSYLDAINADLKVLHCGDPDCDSDRDNDGCTDAQELQPPQQANAGGGRNPKSFWDFFDVPTGASLVRDRSISAPDIFAVLGRFNASGDSGIDPLSAPPVAPAYHTAYDRGPSAGPSLWNLTAANGSIASTDIFAVLGQFNHSCA